MSSFFKLSIQSLLSEDSITEWDHTDFSFLINALADIKAARYVLGAGFIIWLYDIFLTLDDEIEFVWKNLGAKRSIPQALYVVNRYLALPVLLVAIRTEGIVLRDTPPLSTVLITIQVLGHTVGYAIATTIYAIRVYTIFYTNRWVQRLLVTALALSHIAIFVCAFLMLNDTIPTMVYSTFIQGCGGTPTKAVAGIFVAPMFIETVVAITLLAHAITSQSYRKMLPGSPAVGILNTLYLDGSIYYFIIFAIRIADCLIYWLAPQTLMLLGYYFEFAMTSTLTSRWFLSLRRTVTESQSNTAKSQAGGSTGYQARSAPRQSKRISTMIANGSVPGMSRSQHPETILGARADTRTEEHGHAYRDLSATRHRLESPVEEVYAMKDMKDMKDLEEQTAQRNSSFLDDLEEEGEAAKSWSSSQKRYN